MSTSTRLDLLLPIAFHDEFQESGKIVFDHELLGDKTDFKLRLDSVKATETHVITDLSIEWAQRPDGTILSYSEYSAEGEAKNVTYAWNSFRMNAKTPKSRFQPEELAKLLRLIEVNQKQEEAGVSYGERTRLWGILPEGCLLAFKPVANFMQYLPTSKKGVPLTSYYLLSEINLSSVSWQGLGKPTVENSGEIEGSVNDAKSFKSRLKSVVTPPKQETTAPAEDLVAESVF